MLVSATDSDIFPLDKIYTLWDHIISGPPYLMLFVGVSILQQLRLSLLRGDFGSAMLLFSDLPDVSVDLAIRNGIQMANTTPPSILDPLRNLQVAQCKTPDNLRRFSFLSGEMGIVGTISCSDFKEMQSLSLFLEIRIAEKCFKLI